MKDKTWMRSAAPLGLAALLSLLGCDQSRAEVDSMRQQLATVTSERDSLRTQLDTTRGQLDAARKDLDEARRQAAAPPAPAAQEAAPAVTPPPQKEARRPSQPSGAGKSAKEMDAKVQKEENTGASHFNR